MHNYAIIMNSHTHVNFYSQLLHQRKKNLCIPLKIFNSLLGMRFISFIFNHAISSTKSVRVRQIGAHKYIYRTWWLAKLCSPCHAEYPAYRPFYFWNRLHLWWIIINASLISLIYYHNICRKWTLLNRTYFNRVLL